MSRYNVPDVAPNEAWDSQNVDTWRRGLTRTALFDAFASMSRQVLSGLPLVGAGWETVLFDARDVPDRRVVSDLDADTIQINDAGVYEMSVQIQFTHAPPAQEIFTFLRLFNVTANAVAGTPFLVYTSRQSAATNASVTALFDVGAANIGTTFRLEIGGGSTYTIDSWRSSRWGVKAISR